MLNGFDEDLNSVDYTLPPEELKAQLLELANNRGKGLADKNAELLGKNRILSGNQASVSALSEAEKARIKELEEYQTNTEIKIAEDAKNFTKAAELRDKAASDKYNLLEGKYTESQSSIKRLLVDGAVSAALTQLDVDKDLIPDLQLAIASRGTVVDGKAMIGEELLSDYMTNWGESAAGKRSRLAPVNMGGEGGRGAGNATDDSQMSRSQYDSLDAKGKSVAGQKMASGTLTLYND